MNRMADRDASRTDASAGTRRACTLLVCMLAATAVLATDWEEPPGDDAGSLPITPQEPRPPYAELNSVKGSLGFDASIQDPLALSTDDRGVVIGVDPEDLYRIIIVDPDSFLAQVLSGPGQTDFDTQLFLFTNSGFPLLANNDAGTFTQDARLVSQANDETKFRLKERGVYLLGVSGAGNIPLGNTAAGIAPMFFPAFLPAGEISGPDGPGANSPLIGWSGDGETGRYLIRLEGVRNPPGPCPADVTTAASNPGDPQFGQPDGLVTVSDLTFFIEAWINQIPRADITTLGANPGAPAYQLPDGLVTIGDLTRYVELWVDGCPALRAEADDPPD